MRPVVILLAGLLAVPPAGAEPAKDKPAARYGVAANLEAYPQDKPQTALESVLKAIDRKKFDYLLAQLADPKFVDERVKRYGGNFDELVKETSVHFTNDPTLLKHLRRLAKEGEWDMGDSAASVFLKNNKEKRVFLRKDGTRWYLENRQK